MISVWYERERFNVQHPTFCFIFVLCTEFWAMSFLWVLHTCRLSHPFEKILRISTWVHFPRNFRDENILHHRNTNMENQVGGTSSNGRFSSDMFVFRKVSMYGSFTYVHLVKEKNTWTREICLVDIPGAGIWDSKFGLPGRRYQVYSPTFTIKINQNVSKCRKHIPYMDPYLDQHIPSMDPNRSVKSLTSTSPTWHLFPTKAFCTSRRENSTSGNSGLVSMFGRCSSIWMSQEVRIKG